VIPHVKNVKGKEESFNSQKIHNTQIHWTDKRLTLQIINTDCTEVLNNRDREQDRAVDDHSTDIHAVGVSFHDDV